MSDQRTAHDLYSSEKRHSLDLPRLKVTYAWMPPFEGASVTRPNRLEVVFSPHDRVVLQQGGRLYDVNVEAGGFYVIGEEPTTLVNVPEHSDTLEMYPDMDLVETVHARKVELDPTLGRLTGSQQFTPNGVMLGLAHVLRQMCLGLRGTTAIEVSSIEHAVAAHITGLSNFAGGGRLTGKVLRRIVDQVEATMADQLTLDDMAAQACLSPFHFARSFRRSTGLSPHRYVLARKMDHAKNLLLTTDSSVAAIGAALAFDNLHHFRRQFRSHFGVQPGDLRRAAL
ncbi:MAG TPA: AraC family transcriptional regulator [Devosia sp.]|jgi:AraC family transcriptional regulator|uniref:AraC family transcriptional regulator n=1 Tax=Devosia sp. TaxID=1871048 RepID=UPI002DDC9176|nr:AraC family transcriptional regulator [Devosia sp.]HEV2516235.1 AraC family transcriptional regulator [Devosia sp.]